MWADSPFFVFAAQRFIIFFSFAKEAKQSMSCVNNVSLKGRLTRDPDVRYTQGEQTMAIARFTLAVDRRRRSQSDQQQADFVSCVAFGKQGEFIEKYFKKGSSLDLQGHIQTGSYTKQDGTKVYTTDVVIDDCTFGESKRSSEGSQQVPASGAAASTAQDNVDAWVHIPEGIDEELPFN